MHTQPIPPSRVQNLVSSIFDDSLHAKRVASLSNAVVGALLGARLAVATLGRALAIAKGRRARHAIKQVDRFFSNTGVDVWKLFASWVPFVVGPRLEIMVALDWTEFDPDNQATIALYLVTKHGRATPLLWKTVVKSEMKGWRNEHEDVLLERLREVLPEGVKVTVLADRGFGDQALYELLKDQLGFDFVVRFRGIVKVTDEHGVTKTANEWVPENGRPRLLQQARVTSSRRQVGAVVCVKAKGMKEPWCLATSLADEAGAEIVKRYAKRFSIEETFRDLKNLRFGMGLSDTRIKSPERRDRILLVGAIAAALLTLLGAAGEATGLDMTMKANTVKTRTHSLLNQGLFYFEWLATMPEELALSLLSKFDEFVRQQATFSEVFGLI
jgi:hypothetical protein